METMEMNEAILLRKETEEALGKVYLGWAVEELNRKDFPDYDVIAANNEVFRQETKNHFLYQIIDRKFQAFGIDVRFDPIMILMLEIMSNHNPGLIQIMFSHVLEKVGPVVPGYRITASDFAKTYPQFDIIDESPDGMEVYKKWEKIWDAQKIPPEERPSSASPDNRVDTPEYWKKYFTA